MKKLIAAILSIAAIVLPQNAIAQYNSPHKWTDAFGKTKIYIPGIAGNTIDVVTESSKEYTFTVNNCGWTSIRQSPTRKIKSFSTSANSLNVTNFATPNHSFVHGPLCTYTQSGPFLGWSIWDALDSGALDVNANPGRLSTITGSNQFFIKIYPAYNYISTIQATVVYENTIKNKINSCGYGTIIVSATRPMNTFKIAGVDYTLANLPVADKPMICRTQGNSRIRYVPLVP